MADRLTSVQRRLMPSYIYGTPYHSPIGVLVLVSDGCSLTELRLGQPQAQDMSTGQDLQIFADTRRWLDLYFSGKEPNFIPPLDPQGTAFQRKVWRELLTVPYGQTTTYGVIAQRLHCRSARAIGQAVHRNPIAIIIPCHRVIGADGSLTGYASGIAIKQQLLNIETTL